jgi:hypothetical protein
MHHVIDDIKKHRTTPEALPISILAPAEGYQEPLTRLLYRQKISNIPLITDFSKWGVALNHRVYLLGLCVENFSPVLIEKTRQLLALNPNIIITTSETDFKNKLTTAPTVTMQPITLALKAMKLKTWSLAKIFKVVLYIKFCTDSSKKMNQPIWKGWNTLLIGANSQKNYYRSLMKNCIKTLR